MKRQSHTNFLKPLICLMTILAILSSSMLSLNYSNAGLGIFNSISASAYSSGSYKVNTKSGVNVRSGAGTGYSKVGAATNGTSFTVDQINGKWGHTGSIKCTNGNRSGWVCLSYCSQTSSGSSSGSSSSSFVAGTYKVYNCSALNVRKGPGTSYGVKTTINSGTYLYITSKSGNWGYAQNKGGYVSMRYCTFVSFSNLAWVSGGSSSSSSSSSSYTTPLSSGTSYFITPACATSNRLDVYGLYTSNGTNIMSGSYSGGKNQQFKAVYVSNGYYVFYDVNSGKVIDVAGGTVANGTNVQIYQYNGTAAQLWKLYSAGNGYYYLQSKLNSSYYLDVCGGSSSNGANIQLYQGNGSNAQKFSFTKVSGASSNNTNISLSVVSYKQGDSRWKNTKIGSKTIGSVGCVITSIAMAYSYNTGTVSYPNAVKNKLKFSNNNIIWKSVSNCGMTFKSYGGQQINQEIMREIYNKLKAGRPVVIYCTNSGSTHSHAVCITGYSGRQVHFLHLVLQLMIQHFHGQTCSNIWIMSIR